MGEKEQRNIKSKRNNAHKRWKETRMIFRGAKRPEKVTVFFHKRSKYTILRNPFEARMIMDHSNSVIT